MTTVSLFRPSRQGLPLLVLLLRLLLRLSADTGILYSGANLSKTIKAPSWRQAGGLAWPYYPGWQFTCQLHASQGILKAEERVLLVRG